MKTDDEATRDTLPPQPDPMMAIAERIEQKLDYLTKIAVACFERVQEHDDELEKIRTDIESLLAIPSAPPNGNGAA